MPLVFDLGTFGHVEAQPREDIGELFDRLTDGMSVTESPPPARFGRVKRRGLLGAAAGQFFLGRFVSGFDILFGPVKSLAGHRLVRLVHVAQAFLRFLETTVFGPQKFHACRFQHVGSGGGLKGRDRSGGQLVQIGEEFVECHDSQAAVASACFTCSTT